jgi:hypothetical protein
MPHYAEDHLKDIARKSIAARDNLASLFCQVANISYDQANDLVAFYIRKKLVTLDLTNVRYTVKHGSYLDRDYIEHLAAHGAF